MHRAKLLRLAPCPLLVLTLLGCGVRGAALEHSAHAPSIAEPARLIVLVVVDQLPPWQLERLRPFLDGGLGRFLDGGQTWLDAEHDHARTETGPGFATLATGVRPARHGIVANEWRDAEGASWNCVADPSVQLLTSDGPVERERPASAHRLQVAGIAEHVRAVHPRARTLGIAGKDRSAILGIGRADLSLWWDAGGTGFVSSTAYAAELPEWVVRWNRAWPSALPREDGRVLWRDASPEGVAQAGTAADDRPGELRLLGATTFPYASPAVGAAGEPGERAPLATWVQHSPFGDELVLDLAAEALRALELGSDDQTDVLVLGLSSCDFVGHAYGPRSREATDLLLRLDDALGRLLAQLDELVGPGRWVAALSSDHGVLELPESLQARGLDAARVSSKELRAALRTTAQALAGELGTDVVAGADESGLRFSSARVGAAQLDARTLRRRASELLGAVDFVERAFASDELTAPGALASDDALLARMAASYFPGRSPDVALVLEPQRIVMSAGTTHGSPWDYDRAVPIVFLGAGSPAEARAEPCRTVDVLPTLLARAGLAVPTGLDGRVLPGEAAR